MSLVEPPDFALHDLEFRAVIDYVTIVAPPEGRPLLPVLDGTARWAKKKGAVGLLTIHDPSAGDIARLAVALGDPLLMDLEVSIDLMPRVDLPDLHRLELLSSTFVAVGARLRPEDAAMWGYGRRGAVQARGQKPIPFHTRLPNPNEQLLYGARGDWQQVKVYLKRTNNGQPLPLGDWRVRMEIGIRRGALMQRGIDRLSELLVFPYRKELASNFRLILRPEVRVGVCADRQSAESRMTRRWNRTGVGGFACNLRELPDTSSKDVKRIAARRKTQLKPTTYRLVRHIEANRRVGAALIQLQRRMARKVSTGTLLEAASPCQ